MVEGNLRVDLISTLIERLKIRLAYAERFEAESRKESNTERETYLSVRAEALRDALAEARDIQAVAAGKEQGQAPAQEPELGEKQPRRVKVQIHHVHERTSNRQRPMFERLP